MSQKADGLPGDAAVDGAALERGFPGNAFPRPLYSGHCKLAPIAAVATGALGRRRWILLTVLL